MRLAKRRPEGRRSRKDVLVPTPALLGRAHLDGFHRVLRLDTGLVDHAVVADRRVFGRRWLLIHDRAFLRLHVLNHVIGCRGGLGSRR